MAGIAPKFTPLQSLFQPPASTLPTGTCSFSSRDRTSVVWVAFTRYRITSLSIPTMTVHHLCATHHLDEDTVTSLISPPPTATCMCLHAHGNNPPSLGSRHNFCHYRTDLLFVCTFTTWSFSFVCLTRSLPSSHMLLPRACPLAAHLMIETGHLPAHHMIILVC